MIRLGLTGSIGVGKSTTAALFQAEGAAVYDADAAVHTLYAVGGHAVPLVEAAFPGVVRAGAVDRAALARRVVDDPRALLELERLVHPLVADDRARFYATTNAQILVIDVPLLFETGADAEVDAVVVVSCAPALQLARVMSRPGMTRERLEALLARQTPDAEKRARADFVIETDNGVADARRQVQAVLARVQDPGFRPRWPRTPNLDGAADARH